MRIPTPRPTGASHPWRWLVLTTLAVGCEPAVDEEVDMLRAINDVREVQGLRALLSDPALVEPAREHSAAMLDGAVPFGHGGFDARVIAIRGALPLVDRVGENVARNQGVSDPMAWAVQAWLDSPEHRANIEGDWDFTGIGIAHDQNEWYFTQLFADSR